MAKKNYDPNNFDQRQAEIRKAKGNPNKNVHHKKNNSNYKGYVAAKKEAETAAKSARDNRAKQPFWVSATMVGVFVLLIVIVILMNGALKDNLVFGQASMLIIGICCAVIAYLNWFGQRPDSKLQKGIGIVLTVMAVIYIVMGAYGLMQVL